MEPRDCDGGLATHCKVCGAECESEPPRCVRCATVQHGSASGVNLDELWATTGEETDNAAMIARDLAELAHRAVNLPINDEWGVNEKCVLAEMIRKAERYATSK